MQLVHEWVRSVDEILFGVEVVVGVAEFHIFTVEYEIVLFIAFDLNRLNIIYLLFIIH